MINPGNISALAQGEELPFLRSQGQTSKLSGDGGVVTDAKRSIDGKSFYDFSAKVSTLVAH